MRSLRIFIVAEFARFCLVAAVLIVCAAPLHAQANPADSLPVGDGRVVLATACSQCHTLALIRQIRDGQAGWKASVDNMILRGAQVNSSEEKVLIDYLTRNFGPGMSPMRSGGSVSTNLPDGPGKDLVQARCTICHDAGRITDNKRTKEEWQSTIRLMLARFNAGVSASDLETMSAYLTTNIGKP
jgi:cytochrome c5